MKNAYTSSRKLWRGHSCLPCRDSSRHISAGATDFRGQASAGVPTRQARVPAPQLFFCFELARAVECRVLRDGFVPDIEAEPVPIRFEQRTL